MFAILNKAAQTQKGSDTAYAVITFRSGHVEIVHEWEEVRTNIVKITVKRGDKLGVKSFLPDSVEAVEMKEL